MDLDYILVVDRTTDRLIFEVWLAHHVDLADRTRGHLEVGPSSAVDGAVDTYAALAVAKGDHYFVVGHG